MLKKTFTSFDVFAIIQELEKTVVNSRVNNIYQIDSKTLILKLHKVDKPPIMLVLEAGLRVNLTSFSLDKPLVPPTFCMALRKYLRNSKLHAIKQYEFERIIIFCFKTRLGFFRLILELFGRGNIILVDENEQILQALSYKRMRDRNIMRRETFKFPPSSGKNPFKVSEEELVSTLKNFDMEIVRVLARYLSIGGIYAEEILMRANVDKNKHCNKLNNFEEKAIFNGLHELIFASYKLEPSVVLDDIGNFIDVTPFRLKRYESFESRSYSSFNEALDEFYIRVIAFDKAETGVKVEGLKREAERLKRIVIEQEKNLKLFESKANLEKNIGDAIYVYSKELQDLFDKFLIGNRFGKNWNTIISEGLSENKIDLESAQFFKSFDANSLTLNICIGDLLFSLNLRKTLFENAAKFYERSKRAKKKIVGVIKALEETREKLGKIQFKIKEAEVLVSTRPAEILEEIVKHRVKSKKWFEKFRWFISSDGFLVVAGKDRVNNEVLIKKYIEPDDIVFHAEIAGAPFVVIKASKKELSEQVMHEAGEFAAALSRGWRECFGSVDVYWVKPKQLSKTPPSGEYVPSGAFIIKGKKNFMRNTPLRLAVGITEKENNELNFVGGPIEAVKAKTKTFVIIRPGNIKGKDLIEKILQVLKIKLRKEQRKKIVKKSIERIRELIPYNKGRIIESYSGIK